MRQIEDLATNDKDWPLQKVVIAKSGELTVDKPFQVEMVGVEGSDSEEA